MTIKGRIHHYFKIAGNMPEEIKNEIINLLKDWLSDQ